MGTLGPATRQRGGGGVGRGVRQRGGGGVGRGVVVVGKRSRKKVVQNIRSERGGGGERRSKTDSDLGVCERGRGGRSVDVFCST
jgi:hypothetical protein